MEEERHYTLDGGPDESQIYFSQCIRCCSYYVEDNTCAAFPADIPDHMLYEKGNHDAPISGQVGTTIFEECRKN